MLGCETTIQSDTYGHLKKELKKGEVTDCSELLHYAFLRTDEGLREYQYEGCTGTAVWIWRNGDDRYLQVANVGDSHAFLYRDGEVIPLTAEHKLSNLAERGRIISAGIFLTEGQTRVGGIGVTRVLGDHFNKDINTGMLGAPYSSDCYLLTPRDTQVVLASDGLWDVCSGKLAGDVAAKEATAEGACHRLLKMALKSPKCQDNVTITVIRL
eukprot:TRINITY_DN2768_c0_g1_i1.p1 TRINITY_DN2768_c0_g1~~TRINITY_DN2768_c0_g1_i1.p1  ORF type:complete len:212 (-),score=18.24 TRINITY_DN2768_c0_g1_i1:114-749(-)